MLRCRCHTLGLQCDEDTTLELMPKNLTPKHLQVEKAAVPGQPVSTKDNQKMWEQVGCNVPPYVVPRLSSRRGVSCESTDRRSPSMFLQLQLFFQSRDTFCKSVAFILFIRNANDWSGWLHTSLNCSPRQSWSLRGHLNL